MKIDITTDKKDQVIDITDKVQEIVSGPSQEKGVIVLNLLHTTAALTTADLDPGTDQDILDALRAIMPDIAYRHPHDPSHAPDHILSAMIGTDVSIPFEKNDLLLGAWQRVVLLEFDGPKKRKIHATLL